MDAVKTYTLFRKPDGEMLAVVSGTEDDLQGYHTTADVDFVEGVYDKTHHLVNGAVVRDGYSLDTLKRLLRMRVQLDASRKKAGPLTTTFGPTYIDTGLMAIAPQQGSVRWEFATGAKILTRQNWNSFVEQVWDYLSTVSAEELDRYNIIEQATTKDDLQELQTVLMPETLP